MNLRPNKPTETTANAVLEPVDFPCPPVSRMAVKNPLRPFMTFYDQFREAYDEILADVQK